MRNMEKKLKLWVKMNLISSEQSQAILKYEASHETKSYILYSFIALGVFVVSMGVIALVASHWYQISDTVKLSIDFALLMLLAGLTFKCYLDERHMAFESLLLGFILFCLASIGLIAQIYQLSSDIENSFLFWGVITLPAALFTRKFFTPFIVLTVLIPSVFTKIYDIATLYYGNEKCIIVMLATLFPMALTGLSILLRYIRNIAYYWHKSMLFWALSAAFIMVIFCDFSIDRHVQCQNAAYIIPAVLLAAVSLTWVHAARVFTNYQKTVLTILLATYLLMTYLAFFVSALPILGAIFTIAVFSLIALYCASTDYRYWFHFFTFVIASRFFFIYMEHFYGLASTGVALIIAGSLIILLVSLWKKYSKKLLLMMEELSR